MRQPGTCADKRRRSGAAADPNYRNGWPADGSSEPNVMWQYLFDEGTGDITDEVGAVTLATTGSPTYGVTASGLFINLSPGISYASTQRHSTTAFTNAAIATNQDFTFEAYFIKSVVAAADYLLMETVDGTGENFYIDFRSSINIIQVRLNTSTGLVNASFTVASSSYSDGNPHKLRVTADRSGNAELFIDGVSYGTIDISTAAGKVDADSFAIGNEVAGSFPFRGTILSARWSNNITNNSGGPGGG